MIIGITGSTSGLGKKMTEYLISRQIKVRALVRNKSNVEDLLAWGVEIVYGDIVDSISLKEFVTGLSVCYHIAAQVSATTKERLFSINVKGTKNICEALTNYNSYCRLVYCSSITVKSVSIFSRPFVSDYTLSKYEAEKVVDKYMDSHQLKISVVYPGYIFGEYDRNFLPAIVQLLKSGLPYLVSGGEKNAPVVYVDDLCELFFLAGEKEAAIGKKYISLTPNVLGMHGLIKIVANKMGYSFPRVKVPKMPLVLVAFLYTVGYKLIGRKIIPPVNMRIIGVLSNRSRYFDKQALADLGWYPATSIEEGITRAITWYVQQQAITCNQK